MAERTGISLADIEAMTFGELAAPAPIDPRTKERKNRRPAGLSSDLKAATIGDSHCRLLKIGGLGSVDS